MSAKAGFRGGAAFSSPKPADSADLLCFIAVSKSCCCAASGHRRALSRAIAQSVLDTAKP